MTTAEFNSVFMSLLVIVSFMTGTFSVIAFVSEYPIAGMFLLTGLLAAYPIYYYRKNGDLG